MSNETLMADGTATTTQGDSTPATDTTPATAAADGVQTPAASAAPAAPAAPAAQAPAGAPESYDFTAPEGRQFGDEVMSEFSTVAKDLNLSQEAAQKMLDHMAPAISKHQESAIAAMKESWAEEVRADEEIGGDALQTNLAVSEKALAAFGTDGLRALLKESGLSHHPEVVRTFYRIGKAISEDGFVSGRGGDGKPADARRLYAASNMNP